VGVQPPLTPFQLSVGRERGEGAASWFPVNFEGKTFRPSEKVRWKTNEGGMARLLKAGRIASSESNIYYIRYLDDFRAFPFDNVRSTGPGFSLSMFHNNGSANVRCWGRAFANNHRGQLTATSGLRDYAQSNRIGRSAKMVDLMKTVNRCGNAFHSRLQLEGQKLRVVT
jgi:hypothetical protein